MEYKNKMETVDLEELKKKQREDSEKLEKLDPELKKHVANKMWRYVGVSAIFYMLCYDATSNLISNTKRKFLFFSLFFCTQIYFIRLFGKTYPLIIYNDEKVQKSILKNFDDEPKI